MKVNINKLFPSLSIRIKLTVAFLALTVVPMVLVGAYSFHFSAHALTERMLRQLEYQVGSKAREMEAFLKDIERDLIYLSQSATLSALVNSAKKANGAGSYELLRRRLEEEFLIFGWGKRAYYQVRYLDERGREVVRVDSDGIKPTVIPQEKLQDKGDRYYVREALALPVGRIYISPMDLNVEHGRMEIPYRPVVRYATPVADGRGLLIINVFAQHLFSLVKNLPPEGTSFLTDPQGFYLYYICPVQGEKFNLAQRRKILADYPRSVADRLLSRRPGTVVEREVIISHAPVRLNGNSWHLVVTSSRQVVSAPVRKLMGFFAGVMAIAVSVAGLVGILSARHFSRPILALRDGTEVVAAGNFDHRIVIDTNDEIEELAVKFNQMAERLGSSQRRLERWNEELQAEVERRTRELQEAARREELARRQVAQAEKLAALGQLSAGVIHEVANPLAAIKTTIQVMERKMDSEPADREALDGIVQEIDQLASFLKTFSSFARPENPDWGICDLRRLLEEVLLLVEKDAHKRNITMVKDLPADMPKIEADSFQLQQVFLNLILNSFDAIGTGGEVRIAANALEGPSGRWVEVSFRDNGGGISQEDQEKIFDPFFTTKPNGTGLGLSIAYQVVKDHGGSIRVASQVGQGSEFVVSLPVQGFSEGSPSSNPEGFREPFESGPECMIKL